MRGAEGGSADHPGSWTDAGSGVEGVVRDHGDRYPFHAPAPGLGMDKSRIERLSGFALIALGVIFYLVFGLVRGHPTDLGVYSITVVPIVAGLGLLWRTGRPDADTR